VTLTNQNSEIKIQKSKFRNQNSEIKIQKSKFRNQNSEIILIIIVTKKFIINHAAMAAI